MSEVVYLRLVPHALRSRERTRMAHTSLRVLSPASRQRYWSHKTGLKQPEAILVSVVSTVRRGIVWGE
jgi:hypothetical protein